MSSRRIMVLCLGLMIGATNAAIADPMTPANAYIDLWSGPYPDSDQITTGNARPWYSSSELSPFFGGTPNLQQGLNFNAEVFQDVKAVFANSGVAISLTDVPGTPADHTLSLVSGTASAAFPGAVGTSQVGGNGFSFIDAIAPYAQSLNQLEWIIAHNISHELMLTLGVGENYDTTGNYIDARMANWSMMIDPNSVFSPAAVAALNGAIESAPTDFTPLPQMINPMSAPEPTTWALWGLATATLLWRQSRKSRPSA